MWHWPWSLLFAVVLLLAYIAVRRKPWTPRASSDLSVTDPVCGMQLTIARAHSVRITPSGPRYLCSAECAAKFDADPERFGGVASRRGPQLASRGTTSTIDPASRS